MSSNKVPLDKLIIRVEEVICRKTGMNAQEIDKEIIAWISVYRHGSHQYQKMATEWLVNFFVNADFVRNRKQILLTPEREQLEFVF